REGAEDVLLQSGERRPLKAVRDVERFPQVDRRGKDDVRVADDVDEARVGEQLQQGRNTAGGRRRREDQAARVLEGEMTKKAQEGVLPALAHTWRQVAKVEGRLVLRRVIRESDSQVR